MGRRRLILATAGILISRMRLLRLGFLRGRFLGYAVLGLAQLFLDLSDFIVLNVGGQGMTPFGKRFFPLGGGEFGAAELGVNVAQGGVNGGIGIVSLHSLGRTGFGFRWFVLVVLNAAQS